MKIDNEPRLDAGHLKAHHLGEDRSQLLPAGLEPRLRIDRVVVGRIGRATAARRRR